MENKMNFNEEIQTTKMVGESSKNARLGLPCGNSLVEQAV